MNWRAFITPAGLVLIAVGYVAGFSALNGCNLADMIKVQVPREIQRATGAAPVIPLSDAPATYERWEFITRQASEQFAENVAEAEQIFGFVSALGADLLEVATPWSASIPAGGLLISALTFGLGLFTRRPGDGKKLTQMQLAFEQRLRDEKEASHEHGREVGKRIALDARRANTETD